MLRFLPSFLAMIDNGTAAAAAERLHKTPAALSYDLHQLQSLAREPLFLRVGRGLQPTAAGERFAEAARKAVELLELSARPHAAANHAPLRVVAVSGFGRYVLLPALFRATDARSIDLAFHRNEDVARRVRENQADLGFCFTRVRSATLTFRAIYQESLALIAPPRWRAPSGAVPLAAWCREHPCVTYDESDFVFGQWHAQVLAGTRHRVRQSDHYSELEEAVAAVAAGRGYSIVPTETADRLAALHPLRVLRARQARNTLYATIRRGDDAGALLLDRLRAALLQAPKRNRGRVP